MHNGKSVTCPNEIIQDLFIGVIHQNVPQLFLIQLGLVRIEGSASGQENHCDAATCFKPSVFHQQRERAWKRRESAFFHKRCPTVLLREHCRAPASTNCGSSVEAVALSKAIEPKSAANSRSSVISIPSFTNVLRNPPDEVLERVCEFHEASHVSALTRI